MIYTIVSKKRKEQINKDYEDFKNSDIYNSLSDEDKEQLEFYHKNFNAFPGQPSDIAYGLALRSFMAKQPKQPQQPDLEKGKEISDKIIEDKISAHQEEVKDKIEENRRKVGK